MTSEEEFEAFVARNRDLIENLMAMQKDAAGEFVNKERALAKDVYTYSRGFADQGKVHAEEIARSVFGALTDPEVQRHVMNMGMEFFMAMSALMSKVPAPDFVRDGYDTTRSNMMDSVCRANTECGVKRPSPQKVDIDLDTGTKRDIPDDVFKHEE